MQRIAQSHRDHFLEKNLVEQGCNRGSLPYLYYALELVAQINLALNYVSSLQELRHIYRDRMPDTMNDEGRYGVLTNMIMCNDMSTSHDTVTS
jgi:hypothetical protein